MFWLQTPRIDSCQDSSAAYWDPVQTRCLHASGLISDRAKYRCQHTLGWSGLRSERRSVGKSKISLRKPCSSFIVSAVTATVSESSRAPWVIFLMGLATNCIFLLIKTKGVPSHWFTSWWYPKILLLRILPDFVSKLRALGWCINRKSTIKLSHQRWDSITHIYIFFTALYSNGRLLFWINRQFVFPHLIRATVNKTAVSPVQDPQVCSVGPGRL